MASAEQPLRWKAKPIAVPVGANGEVRQAAGFSPIGSGVVQANGSSEGSVASASGWNKMRIDTFVTPAQATQPLQPPKPDPFQDPFSDRRATQAAATLQLQPPGGTPNTNQPGLNPANPNFNPGVPPAPAPNFAPPSFQPAPVPAPAPNVVPPAAADPGFELPPNRFNPPNAPLPSPPAPELQDPPPPMRTQPDPNENPQPGIPNVRPRGSADNNSPSNKPCDRIYNELNCCDTDANCRAVHFPKPMRTAESHFASTFRRSWNPTRTMPRTTRFSPIVRGCLVFANGIAVAA